MDRSAIELIQQTAIGAADNFQQRLPANVAAAPTDFQIHDLQKFQPLRRRFVGTYATTSLSDFIGYVAARPGAEGYIDAEKLAATVFFNLGDKDAPGHADHKAVLTLKATAPFKALLEASTQRYDQRSAVDWIEDWKDHLTPVAQEGNEGMNLAKALAAVRNVTIDARKSTENTQGDFNASRSTLEQVEASSRFVLPAGFVFACEPYQGLPRREFFLRLAVLTSGDKPLLTLRLTKREAHEEAIAQDFKAVLLRDLEGKAALTIGTFTP